MKIMIKRQASAGNLTILPGEYLADVRTDTSQIQLVGGGRDYLLPAIRRGSKAPIKMRKIQFNPALDGVTWNIIVSTPPQNEWIAQIKYDRTPGAPAGGAQDGGTVTL